MYWKRREFLIGAAGAVSARAANRMYVGLTQNTAVVEALSVEGAKPDAATVLLVGCLDGDQASARAVKDEVARYEKMPRSRRPFRLLAVPFANGGGFKLAFPPAGVPYRDNPESHYLWRWIGTQAPDLVLIYGADPGGLGAALANHPVAGFGRIPARQGTLDSVPDKIVESEARRELERRLARAPRALAEELARVYGHEFRTAVYIPAIALIGRLRLGHTDEVVRLAAPYAGGAQDSLAKPTASHLAGHLLFAELAERTGDPRYVALVRKAVAFGFTPEGVMPAALHAGMSDAVFMGCPILAKAGKLTHDPKYFDMALRHLRAMQELCLRADGIYRHSPLCGTAWGRGNGFPALALAFTLADTPKEHPAFTALLRAFQAHMRALAPQHSEEGMWRQVVDLPGAYPEFSCTALIGTAMRRGIRNGWLDAKQYGPRLENAWSAIKTRTAPAGELLDVCESTGKQTSMGEYLRRAASRGTDARGGGMALLFATEMMA